MTRFNYAGSAGLYAGNARAGRRGPRYMRFETAAEALRFAVEDMRDKQQRGSLLEMDEARFNHNQIRALYDAPEYPLLRRTK